MNACSCVHREVNRPVLRPGVVNADDAHRPGAIGVIDDPGKPHPLRVGSAQEQGKKKLALRRRRAADGSSPGHRDARRAEHSDCKHQPPDHTRRALHRRAPCAGGYGGNGRLHQHPLPTPNDCGYARLVGMVDDSGKPLPVRARRGWHGQALGSLASPSIVSHHKESIAEAPRIIRRGAATRPARQTPNSGRTPPSLDVMNTSVFALRPRSL